MINLLAALSLMTAPAPTQTPQKHALIVAIGDYPAESEWGDISSQYDVPLVQTALTNAGFTDITVIRDKEANKDGIVKAIRELKDRCTNGDVAAIHFSSHGQQIADDNGDELDGLDEAIVAWGAPLKYYDGYKGEKHLRDDEIGALLLELRTKLGKDGDVVMFMDACHSGTNHRGRAKTRGNAPPIVPPDYKPKVKDSQTGMLESGKTRGNDADLAPFVVFSAARAEQLNSETFDEKGNGVGSLSYALSKCMKKINKNTTYRSLYATMLAEMTVLVPGQDPVVEGNIDRNLFAGNVTPTPVYFTLDNINNSSEVILRGGNISGIFDGTRIAIYPAGVLDFNGVPTTTGTVDVAENITSLVKLDKPLPNNNRNGWWVVVTQRTFGDIKINVQMGNFTDAGIRTEVENTLKGMKGFVNMVNENGDILINQASTRGAGSTLNLINLTDSSLLGDGVSASDRAKAASAVEELIQKYVQGKFIKQMELVNSNLDVSFELIPVRVQNGKIIDTLDIKSFIVDGVMMMPTNVQALVRVTNSGTRDAFFNIVDIQPDGVINGVLPDPNQNQDPRDFFIKAGQSRILSDYIVTFGPPYGNEVFKLFASYEPIDLKPIITSRGTASTRGNDMLGNLFKESYNIVGTRGANSAKLTTQSNANTFNYAFKIAPANKAFDLPATKTSEPQK